MHAPPQTINKVWQEILGTRTNSILQLRKKVERHHFFSFALNSTINTIASGNSRA
jgi:hypothetical protein